LIGKKMKIGITHRLFLSILAATCVALLCMFLIMQWSINRGFLEYLNSMDQGRLEQMAGILEQAYAEHGNWNFLRDTPEFMIERLLHTRPADIPLGMLHEFDKMGGPLPPPPPEGVHRPRLPFIVLDAGRKPLFGNNAETKNVNFKPIVHNNETVGYVGLLPPKEFLNPPQVQFLSQQKSALILAAIGLVLIVVIFSIPLANRLVRPIRAMAAATRDLASGKYAIRVPISSSDELGQLACDFNSLALTLEKNEKARRQWVADISHELRTPLAVLRGEIEALLDGIRDTTPDAVRSLHIEALRLHRLVDDLYQLALSDLGTLTYHKEDLSLAGILENSIEPYRAEFARKGIKLSVDIPQKTGIAVFADRERLQQLFTNLLDNSLKYTDAGGELAISLSCSKSQSVLEFQDSAPGVHEEELDRLFDRLYRVESSRNRLSGGAGLGLAICRNIVEAHAGTITAHPSPFGGLLIRVKFPVAGGCS
jgi:two-component system, OmpR family, sensor histidine kinase BaeS